MSVFSIFLVLILIVSFLLVVVIMVQNPKGGGLSSSFGGGGGQQIGGVKQTSDFLDKSTWVLATLLLALILFSNVSIMQTTSTDSKVLRDGGEQAPVENTQQMPESELPPME
ncbi:preprotein translocase subunit SecG [Psychroflexus maritimus]|uniref:Protein-export membrane protein SecG n=1 Tax=Psychroflexus maritimus TaxID=2714865 RepID=A0A967DZN0_9FLAO|nr:preprotein translocase subunit SecG [Psychroflexus maritimus]NGZ90378.1 preprotein translocase subunit SecG [Psychroflexus maritimus]